MNVRGAHLRGPSSTIVVSSTTSSSEAESSSHESFRRRHVRTQPPQVKEETEAVTSPPPAATGTPPPPKPFEVSASASVSPFSFAASDISLSGGFDLSADNPLLQIVTTMDSGAGTSEGLSVTAVIPPPPPSTSTTLQIGTAPRGSADLWRERYYTLAQHALFWGREASETQDIAIELPSEQQLGRRATFLPHWPAATNISLSFCLLYTSPSPRDRQKSRMPSSA